MDDDALEIELAHLDGEALLVVKGEVDMLSAPQLGDAIASSRVLSPRVVLDFSAISFMDSTGLRMLIQHSTDDRFESGSLIVRNPPAQIRNLVAVTGLDHVITFEPGTVD